MTKTSRDNGCKRRTLLLLSEDVVRSSLPNNSYLKCYQIQQTFCIVNLKLDGLCHCFKNKRVHNNVFLRFTKLGLEINITNVSFKYLILNFYIFSTFIQLKKCLEAEVGSVVGYGNPKILIHWNT